MEDREDIIDSIYTYKTKQYCSCCGDYEVCYELEDRTLCPMCIHGIISEILDK